MIHSNKAEALIKASESRRNTAYPDPRTGGDPWTIGYGHTGPEVHKDLVWSDDKVAAALDSDLARFDREVSTLIGNRPTTQSQFDALIDFAFNLGTAALGKSTLLKLHNLGDYGGAAKEFARWNKAKGKVMTGLTIRRAAEASLYRSK